MTTILASPGCVLNLGREGENNARQIVFDVSDWISEYGPGGTVSLLAQFPGSDEPYPAVVQLVNSAVTWIITASDTASPGSYGRAELQYRKNDVVVKSAVWQTFIANAMGTPSPTPPEPQQAWVDQVLDAAQTVETATVNGPKIQNGTWWVWDFSQGAYVDTGVAASGGYVLPAAASGELGGVKADPAQAGDTQPVRIGKDNKLYTAPGGGGGNLPTPSPDTVGMIPAVNEAGNGYELVPQAGGGYTPLPLIVDFTLSEEASLITISQDKEGNPLNFTEFAVHTEFYGGASNGDTVLDRSESILYYNNVSTAVGRIGLGIVVGSAGKSLGYYFYGKKLEYGTFMAYGDGYDFTSGPNGINTIRYISNGEQSLTTKYPAITALSFLISGESKTFGVGSTVRIFGR